MMNKNLQNHPHGWGTTQIIATALILLLFLFLLPLLLFGQTGAAEEVPPSSTGGLPIDRTVVSSDPTADSEIQVKVQMGDGEILTLPLDKYLWRVVAAEMPASFELEALKAQAAAARTYTFSKLGKAPPSHPEADVCTDITCCQAYLDPAEAERNWGEQAEAYGAKITTAVTATDGIAILYQGQPIQAVFFSSAAGRTVDAVEVWGNAVPYLTGVDSPEGDEVPNYHSTAVFSLEEFKSKVLAQYPDADLSGDPSAWFQHIVPNSAGGVEQLELGGVTISGSDLRTLLGLRSAVFTVSADSEKVSFSVTGYGHGVGMSQYGANALAKEGKTYDEILKWYYTGVDVVPYSPLP